MNKDLLIKIFENLGFDIVKNKSIGELVKMGAEDAFVFSSIVGSPYLVNEGGVTMKGRSEVFIHRSVFKDGYYTYSPGLFSRDIEGKIVEGNSAIVLGGKYPSIFQGDKYIYICNIPSDKLSNIEHEIYKKVIAAKLDPKNIILFKNLERGNSMEPFYEYLASMFFIKKGYIVENQVPWFQQNLKYKNTTIQGGIPDFSAFHSGVSVILYKLGILTDRGVALNLLPVIRNFRKISLSEPEKRVKISEHELIIGEVKSSKSSRDAAVKQLIKYQKTQLPDRLYTIIQDLNNNGSDFLGEIYIENSELVIKEPKTRASIDKSLKRVDAEWIDTYIKILLLGNIEFKKIIKFIHSQRKDMKLDKISKVEACHLIDVIVNLDNESFAKFISDNI